MKTTFLDSIFESLNNGELPDDETIRQAENELDGLRTALQESEQAEAVNA